MRPVARAVSITDDASIDAAIDLACARVAPTWPLDRFIAVNPFWEMVDAPLPTVSARLTALSGARLLMPRAWYRAEWEAGRLRDEDLAEAVNESGAPVTLNDLHARMASDEPSPPRRARVVDLVDAGRDLTREMPFRDFLTHSVSQFCASYFDEGQARLRPVRDGGLYASWRRQALKDRSPALLMGFRDFRDAARALPATAREMGRVALRDLEVPTDEREAYLTGLLFHLNGWAAWCVYRRWTARLEGGDDAHILDLLAIHLAWEWLLFRAGGGALATRWHDAMGGWGAIDVEAARSQSIDWLLQRGVELAYQREICRRLPAALARRSASETPSVQAVFCIDVRSEVLRRALEAQHPGVQTLGFAGFFGMPIEYKPLGAASARPQLPGLLAPRLRATERGASPDAGERRAARLDAGDAWTSFKSSALSSFAFVESIGLASGGKLVADALGMARAISPDRAGLSREKATRGKPRLAERASGGPLTLDDRVALADGVLRAMSLTRDHARVVVLVGHGSQTRNNPHAAGLDCGACCGQTGEVNARVAAALLNEPEVRAGLAARGVHVPDTTRFLAALHDTTTDVVTLFDLDELPASHEADVVTLQTWLRAAGDRARRERAPRLGVTARGDEAVRHAIEARARDWAQVRPEWSLAGNAAFIVAPRAHCRDLDLEGRAFLHDYRFEEDRDFDVLELIMTAPMVVAHWINLQYYASTVDNLRYGSGNKVLHNVVGGHLGVFEGNGGDLRIGLPMQSLHDGKRWVHTPLRLSVFLEAPCAAIERVLDKHAKVRALVDNEWIHLFQLDAEAGVVRAYRKRAWRTAVVDPSGAARGEV